MQWREAGASRTDLPREGHGASDGPRYGSLFGRAAASRSPSVQSPLPSRTTSLAKVPSPPPPGFRAGTPPPAPAPPPPPPPRSGCSVTPEPITTFLPDSKRLIRLLPPSQHTLFHFRALNTTLIPVHYNDHFYAKVMENPMLSLIAELDGEPVGIICCKPDYDKGYVYVMTLGVLSPYRRLGVASVLVQAIESRLPIEGMTAVALHVHVINKAAMNFYQKEKFINLGFCDGYYRVNKGVEPPNAHFLWKPVAPGALPYLDISLTEPKTSITSWFPSPRDLRLDQTILNPDGGRPLAPFVRFFPDATQLPTAPAAEREAAANPEPPQPVRKRGPLELAFERQVKRQEEKGDATTQPIL